MKRFSLVKTLRNGIPIAAVALLASAMLSPSLKADEHNRKTVITINQPLEVPGVVLVPGTYVMRLFDSSNDRHIVQIMTEDQKQQLAMTFAVPAERLRPTEKTVLTMYEGSRGSPAAIHTWFYPGDTVGQEFLYPHKQAVSISERTNVAVPEVEAQEAASAKEAAPGVIASVEPRSGTSPGETVLIARAEPAPEPFPAPVAAPDPQQPAADNQPATTPATEPAPAVTAADESLPHTAGNGPLAALMGGLSLVLAFGLRKMKQIRSR